MELHFTLLYSTSNYLVEWLKQDIDQARQQIKSTNLGKSTVSDWFEATPVDDSTSNVRAISLVGSYFTISKYKPIQISAPLLTVNLQDESDGVYGSERVHVSISTHVESEDLVLYLYDLLTRAAKAWTSHKNLTESIASLAVEVLKIQTKSSTQPSIYIGGSVNTNGGDVILGDQIVNH